MVVILDASSVEEQRPRLRARGKRVAAAILPVENASLRPRVATFTKHLRVEHLVACSETFSLAIARRFALTGCRNHKVKIGAEVSFELRIEITLKPRVRYSQPPTSDQTCQHVGTIFVIL